VQVEDGLSGAGADVQDGAVSLLDVALAGDLSGGEVAAADDFRVAGLSFFQSGKMFFGNDQDVRGRLGIDVFEGEHVVVFVHFPGRNLAAEDAAEKTVGHNPRSDGDDQTIHLRCRNVSRKVGFIDCAVARLPPDTPLVTNPRNPPK